MASGHVNVHIHDTDDETWKALAQALAVLESEGSRWIRVVDKTTDVELVFFAAKPEPEPAPAEVGTDA